VHTICTSITSLEHALEGRALGPHLSERQYVIAGAEWEFWKYDRTNPGKEDRAASPTASCSGGRGGPGGSRRNDFKLGEHLRLEPWVGHTPGHVCVRLTTSGRQRRLRRRSMHRTVQVAEPSVEPLLLRPGQARRDATRVRRAARPTRAPDPGRSLPAPGFIVRDNGGHRFTAAD